MSAEPCNGVAVKLISGLRGTKFYILDGPVLIRLIICFTEIYVLSTRPLREDSSSHNRKFYAAGSEQDAFRLKSNVDSVSGALIRTELLS